MSCSARSQPSVDVAWDVRSSFVGCALTSGDEFFRFNGFATSASRFLASFWSPMAKCSSNVSVAISRKKASLSGDLTAVSTSPPSTKSHTALPIASKHSLAIDRSLPVKHRPFALPNSFGSTVSTRIARAKQRKPVASGSFGMVRPEPTSSWTLLKTAAAWSSEMPTRFKYM